MKSVLVWVLMTVGGVNHDALKYSPPVEKLEDCVRLQNAAIELNNRLKEWARDGTQTYITKCVQVNMVFDQK